MSFAVNEKGIVNQRMPQIRQTTLRCFLRNFLLVKGVTLAETPSVNLNFVVK